MEHPVGIVDCHAHIIDLARFPFSGTKGYQPRAEESGTSEAFCEVLDRNGVTHAVLVQLSGYGTNNGAILDAVRAYPDRFKAIAMVDPSIDDKALDDLDAAGVVGVRFNLVSYEPDALLRSDAPRWLARLRGRGWFAQVYANDAQWASAAPILEQSGVPVLVDHFGVIDPRAGTAQKGFRAALELGRVGVAVAKLSSPFRVTGTVLGFEALDPFVEAIVDAFGIDRCLWGSDWPFVNVPRRPHYADVVASLMRWFPDESDRRQVLWDNPRRLFGFAPS